MPLGSGSKVVVLRVVRQVVSVPFRLPVFPLLWFLSMAREIPCCPLMRFLPYLLYRAQVRYEHDPRVPNHQRLSEPPTAHGGPLSADAVPDDTGTLPSFLNRISGADHRDSLSRLSTSIRVTAPLSVQARLNSLTSNSPSRASRPFPYAVKLRSTHPRE